MILLKIIQIIIIVTVIHTIVERWDIRSLENEVIITLIKLKAEPTTSLVPVVISIHMLLKIISNCSGLISSKIKI